MLTYFRSLLFIFGLVLGSFLNCTAIRITRKEDFVKARSHCMSCGHELGALDLIPVLSYLISGGRCRYCRAKISARYPITEITFGILTLTLFIYHGLDAGLVNYLIGIEIVGFDIKIQAVLFIRDLVFTGCLFVLSLVDLDIKQIPDGCLIIAAIAWIVAAPAEAISSMETGASISIGDILLWMGKRIGIAIAILLVLLLITIAMDRILKKESLGGGDLKLFAVLALYFGFGRSYVLIIMACILGLIFAAVRRLHDKDASREFPFGPSIAMAGFISLLCSENIVNWYLSTFF